MTETEAADGPGIFLDRQRLRELAVDVGLGDGLLELEIDVLVLVFLDLGVGAVAVSVAVLGLDLLLCRGDQLGQHPGERVDLVAAQSRPGGEVRLRIGEHALQAEHQAPLHLPLRARRAPFRMPPPGGPRGAGPAFPRPTCRGRNR